MKIIGWYLGCPVIEVEEVTEEQFADADADSDATETEE